MKKNPKRGGRVANLRRHSREVITQLPWRQPFNSDAPTEPLSSDQLHAIHEGSLRIIEDIGIEFINDEAKAILREAGCEVATDTDCVRMSPTLVMQHIKNAPSEFDIVPRNTARTLHIGGNAMVFCGVGSPPNCADLERGRRVGDQRSFRDLIKLVQYFNCIHAHAGYPVEPVDIHPSVRHLECLYDQLTLSDKVVHAYSLGSVMIEDAMEMVRLAAGLSEEDFSAAPHMFTNINSSSPLKHDYLMLDGAMRAARRGQMVIITPFTLSGAMAPVTIDGAVMQQNAEALAAIVLLQLVRPGTPVVYGSFTSNVDMKSGAPAFGTPEYMRATQMSGQMARFYNLPLRASNACAANCSDAQATWESVFSLWACVASRTNVVYHAAGWLEGGLCAGYEKFILDCETLQQISVYMQRTEIDTEAALEAIQEVGSRGHFFAASHTQARYKTAFYQPFLSDWSNFESWQERGSLQTPERAHKLWQAILDTFEPPPIDRAHHEALQAFVAKRKEQGGMATDF